MPVLYHAKHSTCRKAKSVTANIFLGAAMPTSRLCVLVLLLVGVYSAPGSARGQADRIVDDRLRADDLTTVAEAPLASKRMARLLRAGNREPQELARAWEQGAIDLWRLLSGTYAVGQGYPIPPVAMSKSPARGCCLRPVSRWLPHRQTAVRLWKTTGCRFSKSNNACSLGRRVAWKRCLFTRPHAPRLSWPPGACWRNPRGEGSFWPLFREPSLSKSQSDVRRAHRVCSLSQTLSDARNTHRAAGRCRQPLRGHWR